MRAKPPEPGPCGFRVAETGRLTNAEIVEVISMSALAVYANILADATGVADDEMFQTV